MSYHSLDSKQLDLLLCLYKFRFGARALIASYQNTTISNTHYRLTTLLKQDYVARKYNGKSKIQGREATYFLTPKAIRLLKQNKDLELSTKALNLMYKNDQIGQQFINECLDILRQYIKLKNKYGDQLAFYSKSELADYNFFPKRLPDGFITIKNNSFWLDNMYVGDTYSSLKKRIENIFSHFESGNWASSGMEYPLILMACETPYLEKQVQGLAKRQSYKNPNIKLDFYTTTHKAMQDGDTVWSRVGNADKLLSLANIAV